MRNLRSLEERILTVPTAPGTSVGVITYGAGFVFVLYDNGFLSCTSSANSSTPVSSITTTTNTTTCWEIDLTIASGGAAVGWFSASYIREQNGVFACCRDGSMVFVTLPSSLSSSSSTTAPDVELLGSIEGGIAAVGWTTDQGRVLIATVNFSLVLLTPVSWDVLAESEVPPFVTPALDTSPSSSSSSSSVSVNWRNDGTLVALTCSDIATGQRLIRVYNGSDLSFKTVARNEDGSGAVPTNLHGPVAWNASGTLFGSAQRIPLRQRLQITLFECNGLRHREITLVGQTHTSATVEQLAWNVLGDMVLVTLSTNTAAGAAAAATATTSGTSSPTTILQLWHRDNYHWFMKHEMIFQIDGTSSLSSLGTLVDAHWDTEHAYRLHYAHTAPVSLSISTSNINTTATTDMLYLRSRDFTWEYTTSPSLLDSAVATVGEGGTIRLTPLATAQVSPPMAYSTLTFLEQQDQKIGPAAGSTTTAVAPTPTNLTPCGIAGVCWAPLPASITSTVLLSPQPKVQNQLAVLSSRGILNLIPLEFLRPIDAQRDVVPGTLPPIPLATLSSSTQQQYLRCGNKDDTGECRILQTNQDMTSTTTGTTLTPLAAVAVDLCGLHFQETTSHQSTSSPSSSAKSQPLFGLIPSSLRQLTCISSSISGTTRATSFLGATNLCVNADTHHLDSTTAGIDKIVQIDLVVDPTSATTGTSARISSCISLPSGVRVLWITLILESHARSKKKTSSSSSSSLVTQEAIIHTSNGEVLHYSSTGKATGDAAPIVTLTPLSFKFPEPCHALIAIRVPTSVSILAEAQYKDVLKQNFEEEDEDQHHSNTETTTLPSISSSSPPTQTSVLTVSGIGAKSSRLYVNGSQALSLACGSVIWNAEYEFLLYTELGPVPTLGVTPLNDLYAFASLHVPRTKLASFQEHAHTASVLQHPDAVISAPISGGIPLYAGAVQSNSGRALERGARLVVSVSGLGGKGGQIEGKDEVIFQSTRGNLETTVPRALTLAHIRRLLDKRPVPDFGGAMELMRTHRVNLNLLYDHSPRSFEHAMWLRMGVEQVSLAGVEGSVGLGPKRKATVGAGFDRWDLFLTALNESDVTDPASPACKYPRPPSVLQYDDEEDIEEVQDATGGKQEYPAHLDIIQWLPQPEKEAALLESEYKVNRACVYLRAALLYAMACAHPEVRSSPRGAGGEYAVKPTPAHIVWQHPLARSVITSYSRQAPSDLESVLRTVQAIAAAEGKVISSSSSIASLVPSSLTVLTGDAALSHAVVVCDSDVELLYSSALGCYDVRMAHTLAQRGQTDPKEYIPFLASLARLAQVRSGDDEQEKALFLLLQQQQSSSLSSSLSTGQIRQRWAIDVHLGRWTKAMRWCAQLTTSAAAKLEPVSDEAYLSKAAAEPLPIDIDAVVTAGISCPVATILSIAYTHCLQHIALELFPTSTAPSSSFNRIHRALQISRGWSFAVGGVKPASVAIASSTSASGHSSQASSAAHNRLVAANCPAQLLSAVKQGSAGDESLRAAIDCFLHKVAFPPGINEAIAVASLHAHVAMRAESSKAAITAAENGAATSGVKNTTSSQHLGHVALTVATSEDNSSPYPPSELQSLALDISKTLFRSTSTSAKLAGARVLMKYLGDTEADEGILQLCACNAWMEAIESARQVNREDLVSTLIAPAVKAACEAAIDDIDDRGSSALEVLANLKTCRETRKVMSLEDLVGAAALHGMTQQQYMQYQREYGGGNGNGNMGGDDALSVTYTDDGQSVVSGSASSMASGSSAGNSQSTGKFSHASSSVSALSARSAKSAGVFSHWTMQNIGQALVDTRSSLRLDTSSSSGETSRHSGSWNDSSSADEAGINNKTGGGVGGGKQNVHNANYTPGVKQKKQGPQGHDNLTTAALQAMNSAENRRIRKKDKSRRVQRQTKAPKQRAGSKAEEEGLENDLTRLLPVIQHVSSSSLSGTTSSAVAEIAEWVRDIQDLLVAARVLGESAIAVKVETSFANFLQSLKDSEKPMMRRDVDAEVREYVNTLYGGNNNTSSSSVNNAQQLATTNVAIDPLLLLTSLDIVENALKKLIN